MNPLHHGLSRETVSTQSAKSGGGLFSIVAINKASHLALHMWVQVARGIRSLWHYHLLWWHWQPQLWSKWNQTLPLSEFKRTPYVRPCPQTICVGCYKPGKTNNVYSARPCNTCSILLSFLIASKHWRTPCSKVICQQSNETSQGNARIYFPMFILSENMRTTKVSCKHGHNHYPLQMKQKH